jgi:uncharacterized protein
MIIEAKMKEQMYACIENHMLRLMNDSAHDKEHIYRVLYVALDIASSEDNIDLDVLTAACLLHDIGREEQSRNPEICHAEAGSKMAYDFLILNGWVPEKAGHVKACILSHRYRNDAEPQSMEAKILFDADKIDASGTLGIARTLIYKGQVSDPLYSVDEMGNVLDGSSNEPPSFFHEYKFKLEKVYDTLYTKRGKEIANKRRDSAAAFYSSLLAETRESYTSGRLGLKEVLSKN